MQSEISLPTPASCTIGKLSQAHSFRRITSFRLTYTVGRTAPTCYWATWTQRRHRFADFPLHCFSGRLKCLRSSGNKGTERTLQIRGEGVLLLPEHQTLRTAIQPSPARVIGHLVNLALVLVFLVWMASTIF